jgi:uncharacterized damage-inducible protein DinB
MRISILVALLAAAPSVHAQGKPAAGKADAAAAANPISASLKATYERVKGFLLKTAELMPADQYGFKPTPEVRSFGQILGHAADAQMMLCSIAKKDTAAKKLNAEKMTTKAEVQKALSEAFAYCDKVYADSTDATLTSEKIELFGKTQPKFTALDVNVAHDNEHYGNLVTYLRMKKLTPPSSQPEGAPRSH